MEETWKKIPFAPDYEASNFGQIRSLKASKIKILKQYFDDLGYLRVALRADGKYVRKRVHQIIAITFIPNPENKPEVNHMQPMKTCNFVTNLEWVTHSENIRHAFAFGLVTRRKGEDSLISGGGNYQAKLILNTQTGIFYDTVKEAAKAHGLVYSTLRSMLNGYRDNRTVLIVA